MKSVLYGLLCVAAVVAVSVADETLVANEVKHVEVKENTFTVTLPRDSEGYAYVFMQPCFGRDMKFYLFDVEITEDTPVACVLNEADRCEMFYMSVGTIYMKVTSSHIPDSDIQMVFNLMVIDSNRTYEAVPLLWENNEVTHSRVYRDNTMRVWWPASGDEDDVYNGTDDVVSVYRYDTPTFEGFHAIDHMPPKDYYQTACSVNMWMKKDEEATKTVTITPGKNGDRVGTATVSNLNKDTASIFSIVVNRGNNLAASYPLIVVNSSSHPVPLLLAICAMLLVFLHLTSSH